MMTNENKPTFEIAPTNLEPLRKRLAKLSKKATKLGLNPIELTVIGEKFINASEIKEGQIVRTLQKRLVITVVGETPKLNGWSFLAVIEHHEEGNILRFCPPFTNENVDLNRFRDADRVCEQCKQDRKRKDTYIVRNDDGRVAQVGRNCLKDFTGHANPEALAEWAQVISMLSGIVDGFDSEGSSRGESFYELNRILALAACAIRRDGFKSRKAAKEESFLSGKRVEATADFILWFVSPNRATGADLIAIEELKAQYKIEDADEMMAELAQSWATEAQIDTDNDYLWNLRVVANMGEISSRQMGLAVSMISAYKREVEHIAKRYAIAENRPVSQFVGAIKKRETFVLTLNKLIRNEGNFGVTYIHLFTDTTGNKLTWFASSHSDMFEGSTYEVKATVTKHDFYKGENVTTINRATPTKQVGVSVDEMVVA